MSNVKVIIDKINSYKSYSQQVKDRLLEQINPKQELSDATVRETLKRVPRVMKANAEIVKRSNRIHRSAIKLERHKYAPELNKLHFKGFTIEVSGKRTIEEAVEYIAVKKYDQFKSKV